ncbi:MAG: SCO1664 family protein [Actinobacteria bacterium]|nr:SCO1664 family protein [Actinomycetota bacterium]MDA2999809.1 SCO1664 family protein [Actinomycetota bacterium]
MELVSRMPYSSNATFLVNITGSDSQCQGIYKPLKGERPLWDFEPGLHKREVAAYELSEAMGLDIVPPTVLRDGQFGEGSVQFFVDAVLDEHYFTIYENRPELHDRLRAMCALDIVANNTDRKAGHCLLDTQQCVWAIDHGVCFAADFKLRTVIWEFGGEELPQPLREVIEPLAETIPLNISALLTSDEVFALQKRAKWICEGGAFPIDRSGSRYPWPLV